MFPFETLIQIDKTSCTPVYRQIAVAIINAISNGVLKPGNVLPGTRELSKVLEVHRKTIIAAYTELDTQDWITIIPQKHAIVSENIPHLKPKKWNKSQVLSPYENPFPVRFKTTEIPVKKENDLPYPRFIIDDGRPDIRLSPVDSLLKNYRALTQLKNVSNRFGQDATQGTITLRKELARYLSETRGINISADNLLVTHGAQMSIYVAANLLSDHKTTVLVGRSNYAMANKIFEQTGVNIIEVTIDENGLNTDEVEEICKKIKISLIYIIPHHHYPTTVTLSAERRLKLLELSKRFSFAIIEDDYDYDYHYASSPYLPLASASHNGNIIYVGSFSKALDPSVRIGFMVASVNFIEQATIFRKTIDVGGDGYMQDALAELIKDGELKRHLKKARKIYHQRRDFLDQLLKKQLGEYVAYSLPSGGMAIWVQLQKSIAIKKLYELMLKDQILIANINTELNAFRFGFASLNEKELTEVVEAIAKRIKSID